MPSQVLRGRYVSCNMQHTQLPLLATCIPMREKLKLQNHRLHLLCEYGTRVIMRESGHSADVWSPNVPAAVSRQH